jgi:diguanylate cyclase (GGDEF)-like protein
VDTLAIYVHRPSEHALEPLLARGIGAAAVMARRLPDSGAVVSRVLAGGDARSVTRPGRPSGRLAGGGTTSAALIIAPLHGPDRVVGVLHLKRIGADARFDRRELDLVRLFAAHVSIALQNALAHRAVQLRAQTDALTALRNHGSFRDDLHASIGAGRPFALLMLDLDDFKTYNDGHGHEAGNELLRAIAGAVAGVCRDSDRVYRYGGDEFCVLLPATTAAEARVVAERVRDAVRRARAGGHPTGVQCSIGIARWPDDGPGRDQLLQAVDRALYTAKRAGRDRVATAGDASMRVTDGENAEPLPTQLTRPPLPTPATPPAPPTSPKRDEAAATRPNPRRA